MLIKESILIPNPFREDKTMPYKYLIGLNIRLIFYILARSVGANLRRTEQSRIGVDLSLQTGFSQYWDLTESV